MPTSILTPFQIIGGRVGDTTDTVTQIEQKILVTLLTNRLERIGIADFGVGISQLMFEPIDDLVIADFKVDALTELNDRVSGVQVVDFNVTIIEDSTANVTVLYRLPLSPVQQVNFSVAIPNAFDEESNL